MSSLVRYPLQNQRADAVLVPSTTSHSMEKASVIVPYLNPSNFSFLTPTNALFSDAKSPLDHPSLLPSKDLFLFVLDVYKDSSISHSKTSF